MTAPETSCKTSATAQAIGTEVAESVTLILKAISDPLRLRILSFIANAPQAEACVCDLLGLADVSQPTISHHLKVMRNVGVLESERRGTWVWYRITKGYMPVITTLLEGFAPAAVRAGQADFSGARLRDAEEDLGRIAVQLDALFPEISADLIKSIVRESFTALAGKNSDTDVVLARTHAFASQRLEDLSDGQTQPVKILFVCVANAGRSQLAAAILNHLSDGTVIARSAGSNPASELHVGVKQHLEEFGMASHSAFPKPLTDDALRSADIVITMGCGDVCPVLPDTQYHDWKVSDPGLASPQGIALIRADIEHRVRELLSSLIS